MQWFDPGCIMSIGSFSCSPGAVLDGKTTPPVVAAAPPPAAALPLHSPRSAAASATVDARTPAGAARCDGGAAAHDRRVVGAAAAPPASNHRRSRRRQRRSRNEAALAGHGVDGEDPRVRRVDRVQRHIPRHHLAVQPGRRDVLPHRSALIQRWATPARGRRSRLRGEGVPPQPLAQATTLRRRQSTSRRWGGGRTKPIGSGTET